MNFATSSQALSDFLICRRVECVLNDNAANGATVNIIRAANEIVLSIVCIPLYTIHSIPQPGRNQSALRANGSNLRLDLCTKKTNTKGDVRQKLAL
jgi:hypothetical protein